jgi:N-hydroxyarylamine O-acetyltransferase
MVARAAPGGRRITLLNRELKLRGSDGRAESQPIASPQALLAALAEHFGLHFPAETRFGGGPMPWPT